MEKDIDHKDEGSSYPAVPIYAILVCAVIIIISGICMLINNDTASGFIKPSRHARSINKVSFSGTTTIILGVLMSIFPLYVLLFKRGKLRSY